MPGTERSGSTITRPARSRPGPRSRDSGAAATPAAHRMVCASMRSSPIHTAPSSTLVTALPTRTSTPSRSSARRADSRRSSGNDGRIDGPASIRMMRAIAGSTASNSDSQRLPRDLAERAGQLDAGRAAADQHERQQPPLIDRVRLALGLFERQQQPPPNRQRIVERLQARRRARPTRRGRNTNASRRRRRSSSRTTASRRRSSIEMRCLAVESMRSTLASSTRTRCCLRRIHRIGDAMSPGDSPAVAT